MIDLKPPELSTCRRHEARFAALCRSRASSVSPVRTVLTCRGVRCGVAAGTGQRRRAAGGVCRCLPHGSYQRTACSRSPDRDRPLPVTCGLTNRGCPHEMVPVCVEIRRRTWSEHRRRNRRDDQQRVFPGVTDQLRVSPDGGDISVDSLTTQLVINRRLAHRADTLRLGSTGAAAQVVWKGCGAGTRLCVQTVDGCQRRGIRRPYLTNINKQVPEWGSRNPLFVSRCSHTHREAAPVGRDMLTNGLF